MRPYVQHEHVVVLGPRDVTDLTEYPVPELSNTAITVYDLTTIRKLRVKNVLSRTLTHFQRNKLDGLWVHVDADVLHDDIMPAVDSRTAGWADL